MNRRWCALWCLTVSSLVILGAAPAAAQEATVSEPRSRAEALQRAREEKQKAVQPYDRMAWNRRSTSSRTRRSFSSRGKASIPSSVASPLAAALPQGPGIGRAACSNRVGTLDIWAAGSMKKYFGTRLEATFPELADGRLFAQAYADHRDYPQEDYFGIGPDSARGDQVSFALRARPTAAGWPISRCGVTCSSAAASSIAISGSAEASTRRCPRSASGSTRAPRPGSRPSPTSCGRRCSSRPTIAGRATPGTAAGTASSSAVSPIVTTTPTPSTALDVDLRQADQLPRRAARALGPRRGLDLGHRRWTR